MISDYNSNFATNCSTTCSNTTIQIANCSCFSSDEVGKFLNYFQNLFVPLYLQTLALFDKNVGQDYNEDIVSPQVIQAIVKVVVDSQSVYQEIYSSNGNVNQTDVDAKLAQISADIQTLATDFNGSVDTDPFTGQAL